MESNPIEAFANCIIKLSACQVKNVIFYDNSPFFDVIRAILAVFGEPVKWFFDIAGQH